MQYVLTGPRQVPIVSQLISMKCSPFQDQCHRTARETPAIDSEGFNLNERFFRSIDSVKIGRLMIIIIHTNYNAEETTDLGESFLQRIIAKLL